MKTPAFLASEERRILLAVIYSVVPYLIRKVATEEASYFLGPRFLAVEKPTRRKVVDLAAHGELLVGGDAGLWVTLSVTQTHEDLLSYGISQLVCLKQRIAPFLPSLSLQRKYEDSLIRG
jgi:hypothetical protein